MITQIISGGQTGADQAGLKAAKRAGIATGGWVPQGCRTDDGTAPWLVTDYGCREHESRQYAPRTVANVRMANGLIWIGWDTSPGGRLTLQVAKDRQLPLIVIYFPAEVLDPGAVLPLREWLASASGIVMVAGNRESTNPGIAAFTESLLAAALA